MMSRTPKLRSLDLKIQKSFYFFFVLKYSSLIIDLTVGGSPWEPGGPWPADPERRALPVAGGQRQEALPDARRGQGIRRTAREPERVEARDVLRGHAGV